MSSTLRDAILALATSLFLTGIVWLVVYFMGEWKSSLMILFVCIAMGVFFLNWITIGVLRKISAGTNLPPK